MRTRADLEESDVEQGILGGLEATCFVLFWGMDAKNGRRETSQYKDALS